MRALAPFPDCALGRRARAGPCARRGRAIAATEWRALRLSGLARAWVDGDAGAPAHDGPTSAWRSSVNLRNDGRRLAGGRPNDSCTHESFSPGRTPLLRGRVSVGEFARVLTPRGARRRRHVDSSDSLESTLSGASQALRPSHTRAPRSNSGRKPHLDPSAVERTACPEPRAASGTVLRPKLGHWCFEDLEGRPP